jgi:competence protein CoiA
MSGTARDKNGRAISARSFTSEVWEELKLKYSVGDFLSICCDAPAIPKTSQNGVHFFAHVSGECSTAPESAWHKEAKALIQTSIGGHGLSSFAEHAGPGRAWIADVYFESKGRQIAIELQHSYQGLRAYLERQQRYVNGGVECYWLIYPKRYPPLTLSIAKWRIKNEFGGQLPEGMLGCIQQLPAIALELDPEAQVRGHCMYKARLEDWICAVLSGSFEFGSRGWRISSDDGTVIDAQRNLYDDE